MSAPKFGERSERPDISGELIDYAEAYKRQPRPMTAASWVVLAVIVVSLAPFVIALYRWALGL